MNDETDLLQILERCPGPAPSILVDQYVSVRGKRWRWSSSGDGWIFLADRQDQTHVILSSEVYIGQVSSTVLLLATVVGLEQPAGLRFALVDLSESRPLLEEPVEPPSPHPRSWYVSAAGCLAEVAVPSTLTEGRYTIDLPAEFKTLTQSWSFVGARVVDGTERQFHYEVWFERGSVIITDLPLFPPALLPPALLPSDQPEAERQRVTRVARFPDKRTYLAEVARGGIAELRADRKEVLRWVVADPDWEPLPYDFHGSLDRLTIRIRPTDGPELNIEPWGKYLSVRSGDVIRVNFLESGGSPELVRGIPYGPPLLKLRAPPSTTIADIVQNGRRVRASKYLPKDRLTNAMLLDFEAWELPELAEQKR